MKKTLIISLILFGIFKIGISQEDSLITVEGFLVDFRGKPVKVSIYTRNYNLGESENLETDKQGYYKVQVSPGTIITYYANFNSYKVTINKPIKAYTSPPKIDLDSKKTPNVEIGHATMTDIGYSGDSYMYGSKIYGLPVEATLTNNYFNSYNSNISNIYFDKSTNKYYIETSSRYYKDGNYLIDYHTSFSVDYPNKLPALQNKYSQGSNGISDNQSTFSYGEIIDSNTTKTYNSYNFFQTGYKYTNSLKLALKLRNSQISLNYNNNHVQGVIPNSEKGANNFSLYFKEITIKKLKIDIKAFYNDTRINFPESNSNYSRLMHSITTTTPTFNNEIAKHTAYSQLSNNPYKIVKNSFDFNKFQQFGSFIKFNYEPGRGNWELDYVASYDKNINELQNGFKELAFISPWYLERNINQEHFYTNLFFKNYLREGHLSYDFSLFSKFDYTNITNQFSENSSLIPNFPNNQRSFNEHLLQNNFVYSIWDWRTEIFLDLNGSFYNSNTLADKKVYILPSGLFSFCVDNVITLETEYSETIKEYPINIPNLYFNSILYSSQYFEYYKEMHYPEIQENIKPEDIQKIRFSTSIRLPRYRSNFNLYAIYDIINHENSIIPIFENDFILKNAVNYTENNLKIGFFHSSRSYYRYHYSIDITFNKPTSKVTEIQTNDSRIPYSGFSDVSVNFVEDYPIGVIVGSSYKRDENDNIIIGTNGIPLINDSLTVIGDPTPDWILNVNPSFTFYRFKLSAYLEYKKGGEIWNGTKNALNYYGTSQESADLRNQGELIIDGVTENGDINTTQVDAQTYLQYYGESGIAENAIEDATWFRINEIALSYINSKNNHRNNLDFTLSIWAKNLLIATPYSGVDPQTALFGYQTNQALDYFNFPALKSFGATFNFKF